MFLNFCYVGVRIGTCGSVDANACAPPLPLAATWVALPNDVAENARPLPNAVADDDETDDEAVKSSDAAESDTGTAV